MSEKYNGWFNRETYLVNLWLTNDENIYNLINDTFKHLKYLRELEISCVYLGSIPESIQEYI